MTAKIHILSKINEAGWNGEKEPVQDAKGRFVGGMFSLVGEPVDYINKVSSLHAVVDLVDALQAQYATDAYLLLYRLQYLDSGQPAADCPRLNKEALRHLAGVNAKVVLDCAAVDIDDPVAHADTTGKTPASAKWHKTMWAKVEKVCTGAVLYETARGLRVIVALPHTMEVDEYESWILRFHKYLAKFDIVADPACVNFNCLFRAPFVTRNGVLQEMRALIRKPAVMVLPEITAAEVQAAVDVAVLAVDVAGITHEHFKLKRKIKIGDRNTQLFGLAGQLRHEGREEQDIFKDLCQVRDDRCENPKDPNIGDAVLADMARRICAKPTGEQKRQAERAIERAAVAAAHGEEPPATDTDELTFVKGDSTEIADRLAGFFAKGSSEPLVSAQGEIWRYCDEKGIRETVASEEILKKIHWYSRFGAEKRRVLPDGRRMFVPMLISSQTVKDIQASMHEILSDKDFFYDAPVGTSFTDCWVKVDRDGIKQLAHSAAQKSCTSVGSAWTDEEPAMWNHFLHTLFDGCEDAETIKRLLMEFIGACLCGIATKYQVAIILKGLGSNGKSTFLKIVKALFPKSRISHVSPQKFGQEYYRVVLSTALLNIVGEMSEKKLSSEAAGALKALTDGTEINARNPCGRPFDFVPVAGHVLACNNLPSVEDDSKGFFRRWRIIPFEKQFDMPTEGSRDLAEQILEERDKIICAAIRAVPPLIRRGHMLDTKGSIDEVSKWRTDQDQVALFLVDCAEPCEATRGNGTSGAEIFSAYFTWAPQNGYTKEMLTKNAFLNKLLKHHKKFYSNEKSLWVYPVRLKT